MFHRVAANKAALLFGVIINYSADNGSYSLNCGGEDGRRLALCPQERGYKYKVPPLQVHRSCVYTEKEAGIKYNSSKRRS